MLSLQINDSSPLNYQTMPDKQVKIKQALEGLDEQVIGIVGNFIKRRRTD